MGFWDNTMFDGCKELTFYFHWTLLNFIWFPLKQHVPYSKEQFTSQKCPLKTKQDTNTAKNIKEQTTTTTLKKTAQTTTAKHEKKKTNMSTSHRNLIGFIPSECYKYNVCIWIDRQICRWTDMVETVEATIHIYTVCEMRVKFKGGMPQLALGCYILYVWLTCSLSPTQFDYVHWHTAIDSICDKLPSLRIARPWARWPDWPHLVAPTHDWMVRGRICFWSVVSCRTEFRCFQFVGWIDWRCWMVGVPGVLSLVVKGQERNTLWSLWSKYICPSMAVQTSQLRSFLRIVSHCLPECSENQWNQSGGVSFALVYGCVLCHSGWVKLNQTWRRLMNIKEIVLKVLKCGCFQK